MTIVDAEARVIREAAMRARAGESLRSIAADLNARGIPSAKGGQLQTLVLRGVLTSARVSGRREYHGEIVHEQSWPAIITTAESDELRALLAPKPTTPRTQARTYLLSGILTCAVCHKGWDAPTTGDGATSAPKTRATGAAAGSPCSPTTPRRRSSTGC
ncbi:MAG TPA: recombinase family protein [Streptosporangiaceae bacterium]|nr:recombinase family protein [Streptosporangiaceae bacterium]